MISARSVKERRFVARVRHVLEGQHVPVEEQFGPGSGGPVTFCVTVASDDVAYWIRDSIVADAATHGYLGLIRGKTVKKMDPETP